VKIRRGGQNGKEIEKKIGTLIYTERD